MIGVGRTGGRHSFCCLVPFCPLQEMDGPKAEVSSQKTRARMEARKRKIQEILTQRKVGFSHQVQRVGTDKVEELGVFYPYVSRTFPGPDTGPGPGTCEKHNTVPAS